MATQEELLSRYQTEVRPGLLDPPLDLPGLMNKIEPIIKNLTKKKNHKAIIERCNREFETILLEIKGQQSKELKKWLEENS